MQSKREHRTVLLGNSIAFACVFPTLHSCYVLSVGLVLELWIKSVNRCISCSMRYKIFYVKEKYQELKREKKADHKQETRNN